jgi:hypothetical protein
MSTVSAPPPTKIMIIRHGEKQPESGPPHSITLDGVRDPASLTVRGWQRAGALVRFFAPVNGVFMNPHLAQPTYLYGMAPVKEGHSVRPQETITPLRDALLGENVPWNFGIESGHEKELVEDVMCQAGVVLICWEHQQIVDIASYIPVEGQAVPAKWPGERFDLVWVFDLDPITGHYTFTVTTQQLLPCDSAQIADETETVADCLDLVRNRTAPLSPAAEGLDMAASQM